MCLMSQGVPIKVAIKNFWTKFPFSLVVGPLGGVGIKRIKKKDGSGNNQVAMMAEIYSRYEEIALIIAPEGSRSLRKKWKSGFYYVAQQAKVPIVSLAGDYSNKTVWFGPVFHGHEPLEEVMKELMVFFKDCVPKYPEGFSLDERYV